MNNSIISPINTDIISNGHQSPECQLETQINNRNNIYDLRKSTGTKNNFKDNSISDLNERVKTFCRIRPFDGINKTFFKFTENSKEGINQFMTINRSSIKDKTLENLGSKFKFDYIFDEEFTQIEVFQETCMDLLKELVEQRKSSILFVNGLNNSGKTYTIVGDIENPGLLPLSLRYVYDQVKEKNDKMIQMFCNYLEIDDEKVYDLLSDNEEEINEVKIPLITKFPMYKGKSLIFNLSDVNYFRLETIHDCSNALNIGNKRKKMNFSHSLTHTVFKIILRFFENDDIFEEASIVFLDIAHQEDKQFENISRLSYKDNKEHMKKSRNIHWQHVSLCRMIKGLNMMKLVKFKHNRPTTDFCDLTILLRYFIFGNEKIVLISNINPSVDKADENIKVLYLSSMFKEGVETFDKHGSKTSKQVKFSFYHFKKHNSMTKRAVIIKDKIQEIERKSKQKEKEEEEIKDKRKDRILKVEGKKDQKISNISPIKLFLDLKNEKELKKGRDKEESPPVGGKTPSKKKISLSEEEKNNLYNTLQKNAPKINNKIKTIPFKNNISLIFHDKQPYENKNEANTSRCLIKEDEDKKHLNSDYEKMKNDYENLQKKFEEQGKLIKTILLRNKNLSVNNGELEYFKSFVISDNQRDSEVERKEILEEVNRILEIPMNKNSFEIFDSSALLSVPDDKKSSKPEGRLYNIILMNPSIQNFTILNREKDIQKIQSDNENNLQNLQKEKLNESSLNCFKENLVASKYDKEFLSENKDLISISENTLDEGKSDSIFSPFKKKNPLPYEYDKNIKDKKKNSSKIQNKSTIINTRRK